MGFSQQEYWSELPCPPPGDLPDPGIEPQSPALKADSLPTEPPGKPSNLACWYPNPLQAAPRLWPVLSHVSHVRLLVTLCIVACQALLSMGFSQQEYWSELPCPPPVDLPIPGIEPTSPASPALAGGFFLTTEPPVLKGSKGDYLRDKGSEVSEIG